MAEQYRAQIKQKSEQQSKYQTDGRAADHILTDGRAEEHRPNRR
jgi:hypothetical protein